MIRQEQIEELLSRSVEERRQLVRLLQESLQSESESRNGEASRAAKWLLAMSGRYAGGVGDSARRADEILRTEMNKKSGLTTK